MSRLFEHGSKDKPTGNAPAILASEDRSHTLSGKKGGVTCTVESIEWWYFDAVLHNGASVVVLFSTKPPTRPLGPLAPEVRIAIKLPHEKCSLEGIATLRPQDITTSSSKCDVWFGPECHIVDKTREMRWFEVDARAGKLRVNIKLTSLTPPVRIGTGELRFDLPGTDPHNFNWLVPVPHGAADVTYWIDDKSAEGVKVTGFGYHDHNWADVPLFTLAHDWYWGHARLGNFTIIASLVTPQEMYGGKALPELVLIDGENIITPNAEKADTVRFSREDPVIDRNVGAPFAGVLRYEFDDEESTKYVVTFRRATTIATDIYGPTSCYRRFVGSCSLEIGHSRKTKILDLSEFLWVGDPPLSGEPTVEAMLEKLEAMGGEAAIEAMLEKVKAMSGEAAVEALRETLKALSGEPTAGAMLEKMKAAVGRFLPPPEPTPSR